MGEEEESGEGKKERGESGRRERGGVPTSGGLSSVFKLFLTLMK